MRYCICGCWYYNRVCAKFNKEKEKRLWFLPFHVDERDVAAFVALKKKSILSWSHTKVRDSNSDLQQMYATFLPFSFSFSLSLSLSSFSFSSALEPIRKQIEFLSFENSPPIRRHWFEVVKQENQAEIFFLLLNLSWICQLIKFGSSSLLVLNPLVETTFQLEHETQLPLWCKGVKKEEEEEKFPFLQIKFKHQFRLYFYLFYNIEWLNQHIIDVVNRLFATSTTR